MREWVEYGGSGWCSALPATFGKNVAQNRGAQSAFIDSGTVSDLLATQAMLTG
jgi:hypothetical protein